MSKGGKAMRLYFPRRSYRVSGFRVSKHAVKQMRSRGVTKSAVRYNLRHKPLHTTGIKYNRRGRPSYIRYSRNKVALAINPMTNNVNTTWKYHTKLMKRFLKGKK